MQEIRLKLTKSLALQKRAKKIIPGMTQLMSKRPDRFSFGVWPGYFSQAKGVKVQDLDGNDYGWDRCECFRVC
jgi:glutamate-1-semialdehyde 2,1-aminomutase